MVLPCVCVAQILAALRGRVLKNIDHRMHGFLLVGQALQLKACGDRSGSPMICMTHGAR